MMNVRGLANGLIQQINPNITAQWVTSTGGYTTSAAGHRVANTQVARAIKIQAQGVSSDDLKHTDGLNIKGVMRSVTMYGNVQGVVRADSKGGDILKFPQMPNGLTRDWRVVQVLETWPEWSRVLVVMQ